MSAAYPCFCPGIASSVIRLQGESKSASSMCRTLETSTFMTHKPGVPPHSNTIFMIGLPRTGTRQPSDTLWSRTWSPIYVGRWEGHSTWTPILHRPPEQRRKRSLGLLEPLELSAPPKAVILHSLVSTCCICRGREPYSTPKDRDATRPSSAPIRSSWAR
jgi:hypothetical protein